MNDTADTTQALVHTQFSAVAENYARSKVHAQGEDLPVLVRQARLAGTESVLDAGCGPGPVAMTLAPHVRGVTAVDFSQSMLDVAAASAAARGLANIAFEHGDIAAMPFAPASFDRIVSRYSAHHWLQPARILQEFRRLVKPDGFILLCDVMADAEPVLDTFLNALEILRDPSHVRDHTQAQWQQMFVQTGFAPDRVHAWALRLEFEPWVTRMATPAVRIAALRHLLDGAGADVRAALRVEADYTFTVPCAILRGTPI